MQARWVVEVWKGNKGLPSRADMERVIQQQEQERTRRCVAALAAASIAPSPSCPWRMCECGRQVH